MAEPVTCFSIQHSAVSIAQRDVVSTRAEDLLPTGADVAFSKIGEAMALGTCQSSSATPMRALVATVVAVGPAERLAPAAKALEALGDAGTVRSILIS